MIGTALHDAEKPADAAVRATVVEAGPTGTTLAIDGLADNAGPVEIRLPTAGRHNAANALGVAGAAKVLGLPMGDIVHGLERFRVSVAGWSARANPPMSSSTTTTATIRRPSAPRSRRSGSGNRVALGGLRAADVPSDGRSHQRFAASLATADAVVIADIWAGRDPDTTIASAAGLADT